MLEQYIEQYVTLLSFIFILNGVLCFIWPKIARRTKYAHRGRSFVLNRIIGSYTNNTWLAFWMSILWVGVKYWLIIKEFVFKCLI